MKKHICPYIDSQSKCSHKSGEYHKKAPICPYNDPLKCIYYNEWLDKTSSIRIDKTGLQAQIKQGLEMYRRRWE